MRRELPPFAVEPLARALLDGVREFEDEPERVRLDLGIVPVFSDERPLTGLAGLIDWRDCGRLSALLRAGFCTAEFGEQLLLPCAERLPVERLVLLGLGARAQLDGDRVRELARRLEAISSGLRARSVLIALPAGIERSRAEAIFEGLLAQLEQEGARPLDLAPETGAEAPDGDAGDGAPPKSDEGAGEDQDRDAAAEREDAGALRSAAAEAQEGPGEQPQDLALTSQDPVGGRAIPWWVAADEAVVARLRRLLSGPPRAARGGASLHT